jgi:hypothetical protein
MVLQLGHIYKLNFEHIQATLFSPWIWKSKCTPKIKSFFWLLANDRLNTKDMLIRKNFNLNENAGFLEVFATASWNIWKQRNAHIFYNITPSLRA